jgi:hypothetical protein
MHVHPNQSNPYIQLDTLHAAERAAAKREAAKTRKKLMESASRLAGDDDEDCVVRLGSREESEDQPKQKNRQGQDSGTEQTTKTDSTDSEDQSETLSDWA